MVFSLAVINMGYLLSNQTVAFIKNKQFSGSDYVDFFQASQSLLAGKSPYLVERYVTSPLPAILNTALVPLGFDTARFVFAFILTACMLLSYWLIWRLVGLHEKGFEGQLILAAGLMVITLSYPFYFLFERGNTDSLVMLLICLSLYLMRSRRREWLVGLLFTLAILIKVYPVMLALPLFFYRRWKVMLWIGFWGALGLVSFIPWYGDMVMTLAGRSQMFRFLENGSIVSMFVFIIMILRLFGLQLSISPWAVVGSAVVYALLITFLVYSDIYFGQKPEVERFSQAAFLYFPFMVVLPKVAYQYEMIWLILLVPVLCTLWEKADDKKTRATLLAITIGVAMSQWQAGAAYYLTYNSLAYSIPGLGVVIAMVGITMYKLEMMKRERKPGDPLLVLPKAKSLKELFSAGENG